MATLRLLCSARSDVARPSKRQLRTGSSPLQTAAPAKRSVMPLSVRIRLKRMLRAYDNTEAEVAVAPEMMTLHGTLAMRALFWCFAFDELHRFTLELDFHLQKPSKRSL